jgi:hypothetical protein
VEFRLQRREEFVLSPLFLTSTPNFTSERLFLSAKCPEGKSSSGTGVQDECTLRTKHKVAWVINRQTKLIRRKEIVFLIHIQKRIYFT